MTFSPERVATPALHVLRPDSFVVNGCQIAARSADRARTFPHPGRSRGAWHAVSTGHAFATTHYAVCPCTATSVAVEAVPRQQLPILEVRDQFGASTRFRPPARVCWDRNTVCHIREIQSTCVGSALHRCARHPKIGAIVVMTAVGRVQLGTDGSLDCDHCSATFDTVAAALSHFDLKTTQVRKVVDNASNTVPYVHRTHSEQFKAYISACENRQLPAHTCFTLLPQLNPAELRAKLEAVVRTSGSDVVAKGW